MGWKNWSYWIRGGIIGDLIGIILIILYSTLGRINQITYLIFILAIGITSIPLKPLISIFNIKLFGAIESSFAIGLPGNIRIEGIIILITYYFFIGAFIGWLVGKIKSKNNKHEAN